MKTESPVGTTRSPASVEGGSAAGVICGVLGAVGAVWAYWMIVPGLLFGIAAIVLGVRVHLRSSGAAGSVAIALGVTAVLLVPSVLFVVDGAEDWGRECTLRPSNPDC